MRIDYYGNRQIVRCLETVWDQRCGRTSDSGHHCQRPMAKYRLRDIDGLRCGSDR